MFLFHFVTIKEENQTIIDDDFPSEIITLATTTISITNNNHTISKRDIAFDDIDTELYRDSITTHLEDEQPKQSSTNDNDNNFQRAQRDTEWVSSSSTNRNEHSSNNNNEYFIKVLVVADKTMLDYHQRDDDLQHYILTLMSHVALLYKDATIGNPISLAVVNIWILKDITFTSINSQGILFVII